MTNPKNLKVPTGDIFNFFIPHERAILLVKCDFSYSCAAADKISTDLRAPVVSVQQLSYLLVGVVAMIYSCFCHASFRVRVYGWHLCS